MKDIVIGKDVHRAFGVLMQRYWSFVADGELDDFHDIEAEIGKDLTRLIVKAMDYLYERRRDNMRKEQ